MAKVFTDGTIGEIDVIAYEEEDMKKLIEFMVEG